MLQGRGATFLSSTHTMLIAMSSMCLRMSSCRLNGGAAAGQKYQRISCVLLARLLTSCLSFCMRQPRPRPTSIHRRLGYRGQDDRGASKSNTSEDCYPPTHFIMMRCLLRTLLSLHPPRKACSAASTARVISDCVASGTLVRTRWDDCGSALDVEGGRRGQSRRPSVRRSVE